MILTCPNCSTRFLLSAQMLAPEGRNVKCSKCGEVWNQLPDPDELIENLEQSIEEIPESVKPIPEGSSVPAIREEDEEEGGSSSNAVPFGYAAAAGVFVLIFAVLIFAQAPIFKAWPASAAFYNMIGISLEPPGAGLEFDRVNVKMVEANHIEVEGYILNLKSDPQNIPFVEITIKDDHEEILGLEYIHVPETKLDGEQSIEFHSAFSGEAYGNADSAHLRFVLSKKAGALEHTKDMHPISESHDDHAGSHESKHDAKTSHHDDGHH